MSRWNLAWLLGISAFTLVGLSMSSFSATSGGGNRRTKYDNVKLLIDVMGEVQQKYVRELDDKKMREFVENMVEGGLEHLDPHSGFFNEEELKQFTKHSKGKFGGIGVKITVDRNKQVIVETPVVGTPAYHAGVLAGDLIVKINGRSTENMFLKDVVEMIQGDPGEKVTLTVIHEGTIEPVDIPITRAIINIDSVMGDEPLENEQKWEYMIDDKNKVAYIRVTGFTETTVDELTKVVEKLQAQGMRGLVIDLRNNPGGLLHSAVDVSSMFLPANKTVVTTKGRKHKEEVYHSKAPKGIQSIQNVPICILINRYSASASEIVAAALQDYGRAVIVGERSYGKGSVQNVIRMEGGTSALKLTTASYWRPSGKNIHKFPDSKESQEWGVRPNKGFEVKLTLKERQDWFKYRRDRDVVRKKDAKNGASDKKPANGEKKGEPFVDRVLEKALSHLRSEIQKSKGNANARPNAWFDARREAYPLPLGGNRILQPATVAGPGVAATLPRRPSAIA